MRQPDQIPADTSYCNNTWLHQNKTRHKINETFESFVNCNLEGSDADLAPPLLVIVLVSFVGVFLSFRPEERQELLGRAGTAKGRGRRLLIP